MTLYKFTGTADETFSSLKNFTARPGYVYDFASATPPVEQTPLTGDPTVVNNWTSNAGPATDGRVFMASDVFKYQAALQPDSNKRATAVAQTFGRMNAIGDIAALTLGDQTLVAIPLVAGQVVNKITFMSGTTAAGTPTHQFFSLYSPALAKLAVTSDDTSTAWAANSEKQLTLSAPYTVTSTGLYYLGCMVAGTTAPSLLGLTATSQATALAPQLVGKDTTNTGLTVPSGAPSTATLAALGVIPWAWVA